MNNKGRSRSGSAPKALILGTSIFNRTNAMKKNQHTCTAIVSKAKSTEPPEEHSFKVESQRTILPEAMDSTTPIGSIADALAKTTHATVAKSAFQSTTKDNRSMDTDDDPPPKKVDPLPIESEQDEPSPYAEEYAKCGCTVGGRPPCPRCRFLLLTDM